MKKCKVDGCENKSIYKSGKCGGCCTRHSSQIYLYGKILERTIFDPNKIIDCGDYYEICLYNKARKGKSPQEIARTKIDKNDLDKIKKYKITLDGRGYCFVKINKIIIKLHQLIFGKKEGYEIDHINNDPLDNRKINLRFATHHQNTMNRTGKGYHWDKSRNKWSAQIKLNYKKKFLGRFIKEEDAKKAAQEARQKYFGEFAYKNYEK